MCLKFGLRSEVGKLKKEQTMLASKFMKLTQQHEDSQVQMTNVEEFSVLS